MAQTILFQERLAKMQRALVSPKDRNTDDIGGSHGVTTERHSQDVGMFASRNNVTNAVLRHDDLSSIPKQFQRFQPGNQNQNGAQFEAALAQLLQAPFSANARTHAHASHDKERSGSDSVLEREQSRSQAHLQSKERFHSSVDTTPLRTSWQAARRARDEAQATQQQQMDTEVWEKRQTSTTTTTKTKLEEPQDGLFSMSSGSLRDAAADQRLSEILGWGDYVGETNSRTSHGTLFSSQKNTKQQQQQRERNQLSSEYCAGGSDDELDSLDGSRLKGASHGGNGEKEDEHNDNKHNNKVVGMLMPTQIDSDVDEEQQLLELYEREDELSVSAAMQRMDRLERTHAVVDTMTNEGHGYGLQHLFGLTLTAWKEAEVAFGTTRGVSHRLLLQYQRTRAALRQSFRNEQTSLTRHTLSEKSNATLKRRLELETEAHQQTQLRLERVESSLIGLRDLQASLPGVLAEARIEGARTATQGTVDAIQEANDARARVIEECAGLREEITALERRLSDMNALANEREGEMHEILQEQLSSSSSTQRSMVNRTTALQMKVDETTARAEASEGQQEKLRRLLQQAKASILAIRSESNESFDALRMQNEQAHQRITEFENVIIALRASIETKDREISLLRDKEIVAQSEASRLGSELESCSQRTDQALTETAELRAARSVWDNERARLTTRIAAAEAASTAAAKRGGGAERGVIAMTGRMSELLAEAKAAQLQAEDQRQVLDRLTAQFDRERSTRKEAEATVISTRNELSRRSQEWASEIAALARERDMLRSEDATNKQSAAREIALLRQQMGDLEQQALENMKYVAIVTSLEGTLNEQSQVKHSLSVELEDARAAASAQAHENTIREERRTAAWVAAEAALRSDLVESDRRCTALQEAVAKQANEVSRLTMVAEQEAQLRQAAQEDTENIRMESERQCSTWKAEASAVAAQIRSDADAAKEAAHQRLISLAADNDRLNKEIVALRAEAFDTSATAHKLESDLEATRREVTQAAQQLLGADERFGRLSASLDDALQRLHVTQDSLTAAESTSQASHRDNDSLRQDVAKLQAEIKLLRSSVESERTGRLEAIQSLNIAQSASMLYNVAPAPASGGIGCVGLAIESRDGHVFVTGIEDGGSSWRSKHIVVGDIVSSMDGRSVEGMSDSDIRQYMQGECGTYVTLGLRRGTSTSSTSFEVRLMRGTPSWFSTLKLDRHRSRLPFTPPSALAATSMSNITSPYGLSSPLSSPISASPPRSSPIRSSPAQSSWSQPWRVSSPSITGQGKPPIPSTGAGSSSRPVPMSPLKDRLGKIIGL